MKYNIPSEVSRYHFRGSLDRLLHSRSAGSVSDLFLRVGYRVRYVCPGISERRLDVTVFQNVPSGRYALDGRTDSQRLEVDMTGIAKVDTLRQAFELYETQRNAVQYIRQVVVCDVRSCKICELSDYRCGALGVDLLREVDREILVDVQSQACRYLRADRLGFSLIVDVIRNDTGAKILDVELLRQVDQILAVPDAH